MKQVSLRMHFLNHCKKANEARLEVVIPFQIDVICVQQNRITNSEVHSTMTAIVPFRLMLLRMPKGFLNLFHLLDYVAHIQLNTFVWMHTPQHIHYSSYILPIN